MLTGPDNGNFQFLTLPTVVNSDTVAAVVKSLSLRGWQIADRWASGSPKQVQQMEAAGTLIRQLKNQQKLEAETISDARVAGRMADVPDSEILAMNEIALLPDVVGETQGQKENTSTSSLHFPTKTDRKFSPDALAHIEKMGKNDPMRKLSYVPSKRDGSAVFDPELNDLLMDRFGRKSTPEEKQAAINEAWED